MPEELSKLEQGRDLDPTWDLNYPMPSEAMWSWLNLAIGKCASARLSFDIVKPLNGAEVWWKLVQPANSKSVHRRNALRDKAQNPTSSPTMAGIMAYVEKSDKAMAMFLSADGAPMSNEDQLAQLQKILPHLLSMEMSMRVDDFKELQLLRDWMDAKATFIRERGGKQAHIAEAELHQPPPALPSQDPSGQGDVYEGEYGMRPYSGFRRPVRTRSLLSLAKAGGRPRVVAADVRHLGKGADRGVQFRNNFPGRGSLAAARSAGHDLRQLRAQGSFCSRLQEGSH